MTSNARTAAGILVLRIAVGAIFAAHGAQKLFEYGVAGTTGAFTDMGVPGAAVVAPAIAALEFGGGILLVLGAFTRVIGVLLAVDMVGAIALVHAPAGFWVDAGGVEFVALLGAGALALALTGGDRFSADNTVLKKALPALLR